MPNSIFQVVVINYPILKIRPPKVCDIQPFLAGQVINFVGLEGHDIERSLRSGDFWDAETSGRNLASAGAEKSAAKS